MEGAEILGWEQNLLQTIMENTAAHLAYLDPEFTYILVNSAYAKGTGHEAEELLGRNHFELFPQSENRRVFEKVRDTGEPARFWAMPIHFPEEPERGTTYWDWSMVPVNDREGVVKGLVISSIEVTDRVRGRQKRERLQGELEQYAERLEEMVARRTRALRASEARFRSIFEDSVLGIALLDTEGKILAANPALEAMLGYGEEELEGTMLTDYGRPDATEEDSALYQVLISGDLGYYQVDKPYTRRDGQERWCELTVSRVERTRGGKPLLAIAMMEDITEKRLNQEALLRAERLALAGRLGASLAHEINNPLQAVIGCLGLAEEMVDTGNEVRRYLELAMEELERAANIVTQLRDLSREPKVRKEKPADLNALLERALLLTRKRCQNAGVQVVWSPAADLPPVPLAADRMQQVFLTLVLNAVEAMPEGGQLQVSIEPTSEPSGVRVTFADTGIGIEPERLPRIFEPFHSTRREGMGLGLYISKSIVEEHDGRIDVESHPGEGTAFTVWLPT
jgi:PAS domain S-box-containing protein